MSYGHTIMQALLGGDPISVPAATTTAVTKDIPVSVAASTDFGLYLRVSAISVGAGESVTAKLREWTGDQFVDVGEVASVPLTTPGEYCIFLSTGVELEALVLPLTNIVRLVVETGPTSTCTIDSVRVWIKP